MVRIIISLLFVVTGFMSCKCDIDGFSFSRRNYTGNSMRTDGYYYNFSVDSQGDTVYQYKIFYINGVCINQGTRNINELEASFVNGSFLNNLNNKRYSWGIYSVQADSIMQVQYWFPRYGCKDGATVLSSLWKIDNDTTLKLVSGSNTIRDNDKLIFRQFSPKPDSTNSFIR